MDMNRSPVLAQEILLDFARLTGLDPPHKRPQRYLWTDAFAVCTCLGIFCQTQDAAWRDLALRLVDQVHHTLGRYRDDGLESGWISGLSAQDGEIHPTAGGLRIGKSLPERRIDEGYNERLEWDRDGQYFHYLTKWMHALRPGESGNRGSKIYTVGNRTCKGSMRPVHIPSLTWQQETDVLEDEHRSHPSPCPLDGPA